MARLSVWRIVTASLILLTCRSGTSAQPQLPDASPAQSAQPTQVADTRVEALRKSAQEAYGVPWDDKAWHLTGSDRDEGTDQKFDMIFDSQAHFRISSLGPIPDIYGFDGITCWESGRSGIPHKIRLRDQDTDRLFFWAISGQWTSPGAHLTLLNADTTSDDIALTFMTNEGIVNSVLRIDRKSSLVKSLTFHGDSGVDDIYTFTHYKNFAGRMLPEHIDGKAGNYSEQIDIQSVSTEVDRPDNYTIPKSPTPEFDSDIEKTVKIRCMEGLMFIHPLLNGKDVGWFLLDTGAAVNCIDPKIAKQLQLQVIGNNNVEGAAKEIRCDICQGAMLQIGPVSIKVPSFEEVDLHQGSRALGIRVAGVCGYDFFASVSLDIDVSASKIRIYSPGEVTLPTGVHWRKFDFDSDIPIMECTFPGNHTGYFVLDTGAATSVTFCSPAVAKYHLIDNVRTTREVYFGAGGKGESRHGRIDWFDFGGKLVRHPITDFNLSKTGLLASPYLTGNVGMGFMSRYRILLDYANQQIAFDELY